MLKFGGYRKIFVPLHRQSKEQPFVPCSGLLLRPTRVINDGRRRSSMKTPKTAGTGRSGELQTRTLNILQTTMINYSIVMRSVNANLLEINQAKKEGKNPDPKDLELVKTEKQNAFAISQYTDIMTIEKFAKHITSHGSVYSRADKFTALPVMVISGHYHFQTGVSVVESLKRSSADGISSSSNHFFNLS